MFTFNDKYILVTGGASGIGLACVRTFLDAGAECVYILDIQMPDISDFDDNIVDRIRYIAGDVSSEEDIKNAVERIDRLDTLVNCAGVHPPEREISEYNPTEFNRILNLNLTSAFTLCKELEEKLANSDTGSVVNISSMVGVLGQARAVDYCASKGGMNGMTRALAIDWANIGVRVNAVCPSNVDTPAMQRWANSFDEPDRALDNAAKVQKPPRLLKAEEIANVCLFLASTLATSLTGQIIEADGGASLGY
jgi:NAD(P)-dependent dehydrogenase (short-subunit alcohol dehydrogenase family)